MAKKGSIAALNLSGIQPSSALAVNPVEVLEPAQLELTSIRDQANALYLEIQQLEAQKILRALGIGYLLSQARTLLPHGEWGAWVEQNCTFKRSMADEYRMLWERRAELFPALGAPVLPDNQLLPIILNPNSQRVGNLPAILPSDVPVRQALRVVRDWRKAQRPPEQIIDVVPLDSSSAQVEIRISTHPSLIEAIVQSIAVTLEQQGATLEPISPATLIESKTQPATARIYVRATLPSPDAESKASKNRSGSKSRLQKAPQDRA